MSTLGTAAPFARQLREISGAQCVIDDPAELACRQIHGVVPALAVSPATSAEVAAILRIANEHGLSVVPAGGCTRQLAGEALAAIDILLQTSGLQDLEHYDSGDLTIGVGAGWTIAQLSQKVGCDGLLFPADVAVPERASVGGVLASGIAGPLRHGYGGLRDYCIGIRFVTGDGRIGKGGGRVVKNVAGYDMMKLLIGSWGTLAVITGASFKLFPAPRQIMTFVAEFATAAEAMSFRDHVLRSPLSPICLELVSASAINNPTAAWSVYVRASGSDAVLARYCAELGSAVSRELAGENELAAWRSVEEFAGNTDPQAVNIALSLPITHVLPVLNQIVATCDRNGLWFAAVGHVGVGHLLIRLTAPSDKHSALLKALSAFRERLPHDAGMAVLSSPPELRTEAASLWRSPTHAASMHTIKQTLDPNGILNRGRFRF